MPPDTSNSLIEMPAGDRQMLMKDIFIKHDRFLEAWRAISRTHYPVEGGRPDFGSLSALIGQSRAGKSSVAAHYMKDHPPTVGEGSIVRPVAYVSVPIDGQRGLLIATADALELKHSQRINNSGLQTMIVKALNDQKVELLIFDEVNTIVTADNRRSLHHTLTLFRKLLDSCRLNIVCIGLEETYDLLSADIQITGRGGLPYQIVRPYAWENEAERKLFRLLCDEFDRRLPFNSRSNLQSTWFAHRLFYSSKGGVVGRMRDFIYTAGCIAINDGSDAIEVRHFAEAYQTIIPRGQSFNPWVHDLSLAPKSKEISERLLEKSPRDAFSKARQSAHL